MKRNWNRRLLTLWTLSLILFNACGRNNVYEIAESHSDAVIDAAHVTTDAQPCFQAIHIVSWNIFDEFAIDRVNDVFQTDFLTSDIIALQEVSRETAATLAQKMGFNYRHSDNNAILSRGPIFDDGRITINSETDRHAMWISTAIANTKIRIYNVHFSYKIKRLKPFIAAVRQDEAEAVVAHAQRTQQPTLITGDFNHLTGFEPWHRDTQSDVFFAQGFRDAHIMHPDNTHVLIGRLDRIYYKGFRVENSVNGDYAFSDHKWISTQLCPTITI